ncbi:MAG: DnaJ domain-containing protein [Spirochaetes bacterium]|nr:DnaJ domain-containing protein [Spirochaetota bacterium]
MFIDYYKLLNVSYTASNDEISRAFTEKSSTNQKSDNLTDNLIYDEINKAYTILINPKQRFKYNLQLIKKYQKKKSNKFRTILQKLFRYDSN